MSTIKHLEVKNIMRARFVDVEPDETGVNVVAGKNAQGKTSTLDAIQMALCGKKAIPQDPITHGERKGHVTVVTTDGLEVCRSFTPGGTRLTVKSAEGGPVKKPQQILDDLTNVLSFDPLAFCRQKPKEQRDTLRDLAGLDTSALEAKIAAAEEKRRDANREVKRLDARVGPKPHPGVKGEEVSMTDMLAKMEQARAAHDEAGKVKIKCGELNVAIEDNRATLSRKKAELEGLKREIEAMELAIAATERQWSEACREYEAAKQDLPDLDSIRAEMNGAEDHNLKVRENTAWTTERDRLKVAQDQAQALDDQVHNLRTELAETIASAEFPVDGLKLDEDGVMFNGVPLAQASAAEQIKISAAVGLAMNPELRILIVRDASLLDEDSMAALRRFAEENGAQIWAECVGAREDAMLVLEDGYGHTAEDAAE